MREQSIENTMLRYLLKTIQYRMGKALAGAPDNFGAATAGYETRTPAEILSHVSDVLGFTVAQWDADWVGPKTVGWPSEVCRYRATLVALDEILAKHSVTHDTALRFMQGPLTDVLTHVGQLAMLRRMTGAPVVGENYFIAELPEVYSEDLC